MDKINYLSGSKQEEWDNRKELIKHLKNNFEKLDVEIIYNLELFMNRQSLSRLLFMDMLYKKIINVHGVIMEFGVRWGRNLVLLSNLRGIYEPYNYNRKIIGFDTFEGFPDLTPEDGTLLKKGDYKVLQNWEKVLEKILECHEKESPIPHIKKFEIVKGDAIKTSKKYIEENP